MLHFLGEGIYFFGLQTEEEEEEDEAAAEGNAEKSGDDAKPAAKPESDDKEEGEVGPRSLSILPLPAVRCPPTASRL